MENVILAEKTKTKTKKKREKGTRYFETLADEPHPQIHLTKKPNSSTPSPQLTTSTTSVCSAERRAKRRRKAGD